MSEQVFCLDTSVLIYALTREEPLAVADAAEHLVMSCLARGRLVAPAFGWAETGSVLRKKVRGGLVEEERGAALWSRFCRLPIDYLDFPALRLRAWEIAEQYRLPTLYDAAFLACTELASALEPASREFWTADGQLLRALGTPRPSYVRGLGE